MELRHNIKNLEMETDKDHIHLMIQFPPRVAISAIVNRIKSLSTYYIWRKIITFWLNIFGKKRPFGQMVTLFVLLERLVLKQYKNIYKIKDKALVFIPTAKDNWDFYLEIIK